ncbi:hypothetical protein WNY78_12430 [Psychroserpens sp. AS72]|uniref:hypothetical protein n=1 Tax=Psychroserpens sp. AS72 TaxID=3135775 RepID=UPI0031787B55
MRSFIFIGYMNTSQQISQILTTIQSFQIIQCQMHHEKVAVDVEGNPIQNALDDTLVFDRVNLCDLHLRNKRLGCAHSGVNIKFERVLEELKTIVPQCTNQISEFKNVFNSTVTKIYALDHKVGYLEHDIALCALNFDTIGKDKLEQSLRKLKMDHSQLMNKLSEIKSDIEQVVITESNYSQI